MKLFSGTFYSECFKVKIHEIKEKKLEKYDVYLLNSAQNHTKYVKNIHLTI